MLWQQMRSFAGVALAVVVAIVGAGLFVRAAGPSRAVLTAVPRRNAPEQPGQPPVKPLTGIVRDTKDRPVGGATVVGGQFNGKPNHRVGATGPDGRFTLTPDGDSPNLEFVIAYKEGLAPASAWRIAGVDKEGEVNLVLTEPAPFVGIVKDRDGKPIAGASVRIVDAQYSGEGAKVNLLNVIDDIFQGTPLEKLFRTTTDADGGFRFTNLPARAKATLVVKAAGMGEYHTRNRKRPDGESGHEGTPELPAEVILAPAARVFGQVTSRFPSIKVSGLKIGMQGSHESHGIWRDAHTDANGRFAFDGLDEGTANIFLMDHPNDGPWTYRAAVDTELKPGRTTEVEIELIRGVQVEGQVVDADSGQPVAGVAVALYGPIRPRSGAAIISATTDEKGRYRFRLPPGETYFYIFGRPIPSEFGRMSRGSQTVVIPDDTREFTVPRIEIRREKAAQ